MKRVWKKTAIMLLALFVMFTSGVMAYAETTTTSLRIDDSDNDGTGTVTNTGEVKITGIGTSGDELPTSLSFSTWRVIHATYTTSSNSLVWELEDWVKTALKANNTYKDYTDSQLLEAVLGLTTISSEVAATQQQSEIVNILAAYAVSNSSTVSQYTQGSPVWSYSSEQGTATAELPVGAYLVIPNATNMTFQNMLVSVDAKYTTTNGSTAANGWVVSGREVVLKGRTLTIEKKILETSGTSITKVDASDAQMGDTITYQLTVDVPEFSANDTTHSFVVTDTSSTTELSIDESSVLVKAYANVSDTNPATLTKYNSETNATNYNCKVTLDSGVLTIDFTDNYLSTFYTSSAGAYPYKYVVITYNATLLTTAVTVDEQTAQSKSADGNDNTARLSYLALNDTDKEANTASDNATVYTYGVEVTKKGESNAVLSNATFTLYKGSDKITVSKDSSYTDTNVYRVDSQGTDSITTGTDGKVTILGLDADVAYTLKETVAPSGYSLNTNYVVFTLKAATDNGSTEPNGKLAEISGTSGTVVTEMSGDTNIALATGATATWGSSVGTDTAVLTLSVTDTKIAALPATGSIGIIVFTIAGVAIMILALVLINSGKSKQKKA